MLSSKSFIVSANTFMLWHITLIWHIFIVHKLFQCCFVFLNFCAFVENQLNMVCVMHVFMCEFNSAPSILVHFSFLECLIILYVAFLFVCLNKTCYCYAFCSFQNCWNGWRSRWSFQEQFLATAFYCFCQNQKATKPRCSLL